MYGHSLLNKVSFGRDMAPIPNRPVVYCSGYTECLNAYLLLQVLSHFLLRQEEEGPDLSLHPYEQHFLFISFTPVIVSRSETRVVENEERCNVRGRELLHI